MKSLKVNLQIALIVIWLLALVFSFQIFMTISSGLAGWSIGRMITSILKGEEV